MKKKISKFEYLCNRLDDKYKRRPGVLKSIRIKNKLNQDEFSYLLGIDQSALSLMENGKRRIKQNIINIIQERYRVRI